MRTQDLGKDQTWVGILTQLLPRENLLRLWPSVSTSVKWGSQQHSHQRLLWALHNAPSGVPFSKPPFTRCPGENNGSHSQFLSLSHISSNRRWEKVPFSKYIRHPTSSHQLLPSHDNIPGDTQEPPTGPPASILAPSAVSAAIQARGVFRNHKANQTSTLPCSEAAHGLPISQVHPMGDRPPMIWPPLRPHLTSLPHLAPPTWAFLKSFKMELRSQPLGHYFALASAQTEGSTGYPCFIHSKSSPPQRGHIPF